MTEDKFSHTELIEFREKLQRLKGEMNTYVNEMDVSIFLNAKMSKENTTIDNMYYAGGTLLIDILTKEINGQEQKSTVVMNISDETIYWIHNGKEQARNLMSIQTLWFAFSIYGTVKGHHRKYYRECYKKSCIRHLYNFLMERRPVDEKGTLPDEAIMAIYDTAEKVTDFTEQLFSKLGIKV